MHIPRALGWHGRITVVRYDLDGLPIGTDQFDNLIVDAGLDALAQALDSTASYGSRAIGWVALGDDNTAPAAGDTALGSEQFRKRITSQTLGATGVIDTTAFITPSEANGFTIEEVGWFTADATSTPDSGTLIARVLYNLDKTSQESVQITRTDTFTTP